MAKKPTQKERDLSKKNRIQYRRRLPVIAAADRARRPNKPTKEDPLIISASELRDFLRCRVKWVWRHHHQIVPLKKPVPLTFGGLGHDIQQSWYGIKSAKKRTTKAMQEIVDHRLGSTSPEELSLEDLELLKAMSIGYAAWARPRDREIRLANPQTELFFDLPLTADESIRVIGYIDVVFEPQYLKHTIGCFENKFKAKIDMSVIDMNQQLSVYLWAMRRLFPDKKRYVAWYQIHRKQMPGPRVKADLFAREPIERTQDEIHQWEMDTQRMALEMLDAAIYPNPMSDCSWDCDYQVPCLLRGTPDLEGVLTSQYKKK
jgi:hypothetical protein